VSEGVTEYCDHESGEWRPVDTGRCAEGLLLRGLCAGHTYSFRGPGLPTAHITIPHDTPWQQEQFERRYQELQVIGRGRTAVVRLAQDRGTGLRVALKEVDRRRIPQLRTRAEYSYLTSLNHSSIVRALAMFENAPRPGHDTTVMELVQGQDVFSHFCSLSSVSEGHIRLLTRQLLSAFDHLQLQQIVHCDIKPDNLLVESVNNQFHVKIIDFGSACSMIQLNKMGNYKAPLSLDLEFAPPELLGELPSPTLTADMWSCAVLVYILLSGVFSVLG